MLVGLSFLPASCDRRERWTNGSSKREYQDASMQIQQLTHELGSQSPDTASRDTDEPRFNDAHRPLSTTCSRVERCPQSQRGSCGNAAACHRGVLALPDRRLLRRIGELIAARLRTRCDRASNRAILAASRRTFAAVERPRALLYIGAAYPIPDL